MLQHLSIKNYALIEELDIDLHKGFSVITGETGAGKSILLGAIGLLLGQRADSKSIRTGASRCVIEAIFDLTEYHLSELFEEMDIDFDGAECIVRRELTTAGKSRAFINDTPASVAQLRALGERLIDIHSQHQNLMLAQEDFQLNVLDTLAQNEETLSAYKASYAVYVRLCRQLEEMRKRLSQSRDDEDYLRFQLQQLTEAQLQAGEDEEMENEQQMLEHAEEIKVSLQEASSAFSDDDCGLLPTLKKCSHLLESVSGVFLPAEELSARLESCLIELKDISAELDGHCDDVESDPQRLAYIEERLSTIYDLERKHHVNSVQELLQIQRELETKVGRLENGEEDLQALQEEVRQALSGLQVLAAKLTKLRQKAARQLERTMEETLVPLGIPNVRFAVEIGSMERPEPTGTDRVTYLFSANKNSSLQPISQVASGGEIARVMLSLKSILSSAKSLPTIIFDEIDTGVSGQIAERMALIMKRMGEENKRQVISITHLPQIAALGTHHFRVYKEDNDNETNSHIVSLSPDERVEEIAHMLSGSTITEAAMENARNLLNVKS